MNKLKNFESVDTINTFSECQFKTIRNFFLKISITIGKVDFKSYNINWDILNNIDDYFSKLEKWSLQRNAIYKHVLLQKMGVFNYKPLIKKTNVKKISNNFINSINQIPSRDSNRLERHKSISSERQRHEHQPLNHIDKEFNKRNLTNGLPKANITKIILDRIKTSLPSKDIISNEAFNELFTKVKKKPNFTNWNSKVKFKFLNSFVMQHFKSSDLVLLHVKVT